jgi:hypothetical protein
VEKHCVQTVSKPKTPRSCLALRCTEVAEKVRIVVVPQSGQKGPVALVLLLVLIWFLCKHKSTHRHFLQKPEQKM